MKLRWATPMAIAALVVSTTLVAPAGAAPAGGTASALTADRAPKADTPGAVRRTQRIGGDPQGARRTTTTTTDVPAPGLGMQEWYPIELRQLADRLQLLVNTANGNVIVRYQDLRVSGIGFGTDVSHVYNNLTQDDEQGSFGRGWTMSTGEDVWIDIQSSKVVLHGPTGYESTFTRNSNGSYKAGSGLNAALTKKSDGQFELEWDDSEDVWTFHSNGSLREMRNNNDVKIKLNYDAANDDRLAAIYDPLGRVTTMSEYDAGNRIVRMTDWTGGVHGPFEYDESGNLKRFPDRLGHQIAFGYEDGNLTSITDPQGNTYSLTYDDQRRVETISEPTGAAPAVTTYEYPESKKTTEKDPRGNTSTYHFDDEGRQTKAIDPNGNEQGKSWNANSDVASTTNGLGAKVSYGFDETTNNPTSATLPTGAKSVTGYTDATHPSFPTSMTDPQGNQVKHTYGADGDLLSTKSVTLNKDLYKYEYNDRGQVTRSTDPDGRVTKYGYDDGGRLTSEFPPGDLKERSFKYDDRDRITDTTDGNGNKIHYRYDALDRLVEVQRVEGTTYTPIQYIQYDPNGNLRTRSFADNFAEFLYNPRNQVTEARNTRGGFRYDVYYRYDLNNNLTRIQDAGGLVDYEYDEGNRLKYQSGPKSGMWAQFGYDKADHRTSTRFASDFKVTAEYDKSGRQTSLEAKRPDGSKPIDRTYKWDDADGDTSILQKETREGSSISYRYDERNRLLQAGSHTYKLDEASNLKEAEGRTFTNNDGGQVASSGGVTYTHDGNGNLKSGSGGELTASYSPTNQLTSFATTGAPAIQVTYQSTDQTQRAVIKTGAREQVLTNTAIGVIGVVTDGKRSSFVRDSAGTLIGQIAEDGKPLYAVTDHQGSTLLLVDADHAEAAKYTYKPYGETTKSGPAAAANPFRWIGGWQLDDAHGTYLLGHRQHDPKLARFTQVDPSGQELNRYSYGMANPVTNTDPTGLDTTSVGLEACLGVCLGAGVAADEQGNVKPYVSLGVGFGIGFPLQTTTQPGDVQSGLSTSGSCSAGPVGVSVGEDLAGNDSYGSAAQAGAGCSLGLQLTGP